MFTRSTLFEFLLLTIVVSAGQRLMQWFFSQVIAVPAIAIFFGFNPPPAVPAGT